MSAFFKSLFSPGGGKVQPQEQAPARDVSPGTGDFSPSPEHCRAAFEQLSVRLPAGFVGEDWYQAWAGPFRAGSAWSRGEREALAALLPPTEDWPPMVPACLVNEEISPADLFLRTVNHLAAEKGRVERAGRVAAAFPWRRFEAVQDSCTCPEHLALHGVMRDRDDPFWAGVDADFRWGCRCISTSLNARTAERRGFILSS